MSGIRAYIAVGPQFGPAVLLLIGAVLLRLLSSVNRSVTCTEFAGGSFLKLIARFCFVTAEAAVRSRRKTDLASIALTLAALAILAMRLRTEGFGGWVEGFLGGDVSLGKEHRQFGAQQSCSQ